LDRKRKTLREKGKEWETKKEKEDFKRGRTKGETGMKQICAGKEETVHRETYKYLQRTAT
jgi:hypothetical protein